MRKLLTLPLKQLVLVALVMGSVGLSLVAAPSANAGIGNQWGPNAGDFGNSEAVYFTVSRQPGGGNWYNDPAEAIKIESPQIDLKLYSTIPNPLIIIYHPDHCKSNGATFYPDTALNPGDGLGWDTTFYFNRIDGNEVTGQTLIASGTNLVRPASQLAACTGGFRTYQLSGLQRSTIPGRTDLYVSTFSALARFGQVQWNSFKMQILNPNFTANTGGFVSYRATGTSSFTLKQGVVDPDQYTNYTIKFAPNCSIGAAQNITLRWYDDDANEPYQSSRPITGWIRERDAVTKVQTAQYNFAPRAGNGATGTQTLFVKPNHIYEWQWNNVHIQNAVQIQVPFDQIFYHRPCPPANASMRPVVTKNTPDVVEDGQVVQFTHTVYNDGPNAASTAYTVNKQTGPPTPLNGSTPSMANGGSFQVTQYNYVASAAAGTRCDSLRIQPSDASLPASSLTDEACVTVGKRPLTHFRGADVWAGGGFKKADGTCDMNMGAIRSTDRTLQSGAFAGSHSEYGAFAQGQVTEFGSGSIPMVSNLGGESLTFANTILSGPFQDQYGYFASPSHCITDFVTAYSNLPLGAAGAINLATTPLEHKIRANGNVTLTASAPLAAGRHQVIYVNGNVNINSNITFANGPYANTSQIPSVIIVATGNITVAAGVTDISGLFVSLGDFNTCDVIAPTGLTTATCAQQLRINGAVAAEKVNLRRTFGASGATDAERQAPGELFNLTPYTYMSGMAAGSQTVQVRTVLQQDLPPRY